MHKDFVTEFLDSCGFFPHSGLGVLVDRALITISPFGDTLEMHDLLQDMGREIGRLSRVWSYEDVDRMLKQNMAREAVEGIVLVLNKTKEVYLNTEAFVSMPKLRLLKLNHNCYTTDRYNDECLVWNDSHHTALHKDCKQYVSGELKFLSHELRLLIWPGSPLKYLPANFHPKNLVYLDMPHCHLEQLWEGTKPLKNLEYINLSFSQYLRKLPDLTEATNLKKVILEGCISLLEVHPSISVLKHLVCLNLKGCKKLKSLSSSIHMNSLKLLDLSGCSNLEEFPEISGDMNELPCLNLDETAIKELPSSIEFLQGLVTLTMSNCRSLVCLPDNICKLACLEKLYLDETAIKELPSSIEFLQGLVTLTMRNCRSLVCLPDNICKLACLEKLYLDETAIKELPSSIEFLQGLVTLTMSNCRSLVCLPDNICKLACLEKLYLDGCSKLSNLPENLGDLKHLYHLRVEESGIQQLPFSILRLSYLGTSLSCEGCKEMTAPFSSWPTWIQENPSYSVLVYLDLSDCNLLELSDGISHLSSLESLKLCRNNKLESLPVAMNRLVRLTDLHLEGCKKLKSIPELSSSIQIIDAHDCTALKTVSTPKPPHFFNCLFYNCFQLVQTNLFTDIVETVVRNCFRLVRTSLFQAYYEGHLFVSLPAGSGIPNWFNHQCRGPSVTVQLPPNWFPNKFLGLTICAISNLRGADNSTTLESALCWCTFKANDGDEESFHFPLVDHMGSTNNLLESDHMFLRYRHSSSPREWQNQGKYTEARFRVVRGDNGFNRKDPMTLEDCSWITSCGVSLFPVNNEDSLSVDLWDSERSKRKRETIERDKETMGVAVQDRKKLNMFR
ncbi:hypothetical protein M0R45_034795 [Rubus argutus]|uniref:Uncharacterized protein n=1 Tax=Rubus argutus TaxID=59490 RepID=A0AAW1VUV4_RUBAR